MAYGEHTMAVDTHVFRVSNRTGLAPGKTPLEVELKLLKIIPPQFAQHAHHWLILHGRSTCVARKPDCPHCVVRDLCAYKDKTPGPGDVLAPVAPAVAQATREAVAQATREAVAQATSAIPTKKTAQ